MSGRPAVIKQRDAKQLIQAAKKCGAREVRFMIGEIPVIVPLVPEDDNREVLADSNNSFDRIMRDK